MNPRNKPLRSPSFFQRDAEIVAPDLLGDWLISTIGPEPTGGIITETEAYISEEDDANHALQSGKTDRNQVMFSGPGLIYVYLIYGMYHCMNVVCRNPGVPEAVLLRAIVPRLGLEKMTQRRSENRTTAPSRDELASGPGKLCMALGITETQNGQSVCENESLTVRKGQNIEENHIQTGPRVGVEYAERASDWPLRFQADPNVIKV